MIEQVKIRGCLRIRKDDEWLYILTATSELTHITIIRLCWAKNARQAHKMWAAKKVFSKYACTVNKARLDGVTAMVQS